jgi:hypothetical protein
MLHELGSQYIVQFSYMGNLFGNDYRIEDRMGYLRDTQLPPTHVIIVFT